jgi:hypothetical protein
MDRRELLKSALSSLILPTSDDILISYKRINQSVKFNDLSSSYVWDNAIGAASCSANKTSIYLFEGNNCIGRMVNISTTNIDGVDDFSVCGSILVDMCAKNFRCGRSLRMNDRAYNQLLDWFYSQKEVKEPVDFKRFGGAEIVIDDRISNNQATVP